MHSVTPSGFYFIHSLCAGVTPLPVLWRPRRGLVALVAIGNLKGQHAASPGHRPGEHGNTPSTGQQTATTRPLPDRDTKNKPAYQRTFLRGRLKWTIQNTELPLVHYFEDGLVKIIDFPYLKPPHSPMLSSHTLRSE